MNYLIDFDSRDVLSKNETRQIVENFILDNDLTLAVALIDSEEELTLQLSSKELSDLSVNIGCDRTVDANLIWERLEENKKKFPTLRGSKKKLKIKSMSFENTNKVAATGATNTRIQEFIEDNLDEATFKELRSRFNEVDIERALVDGYIRGVKQ